MRRRVAVIALAALVTFTERPLHAQLATPGESGVVMGHLHFVVRDLEAHRRFWAALGGVPIQNGTLQLIQFPGTFVMLRQGNPTGGTIGSLIDHVGFQVNNMKEWLAKWHR